MHHGKLKARHGCNSGHIHITTPSLPLSCCGDAVHHFHDAMKSGVCANGHVCPTEVIIDRSNHAHDVKMRCRLGLLFSDLA